MFKLLKNHKGQGLTVQYTLTFFFVVAIIMTMMMYFKRTLQGRIRDATYYMVDSVNVVFNGQQTGIVNPGYMGQVYVQYEPYYLQTRLERIATDDQDKRLLPSSGSPMGISDTVGITVTNSTSLGTQARPGQAAY